MSKLESSSLFQLTSMRFRLFLREPEAIFWTFLFPILLAMGLGIAFRNRPADVLQVGATTAQLTQALAGDKGLTAATMDEAAGTRALATGNILLLAIQRPEGIEYKFDDTNPDARTARLVADRAIQTAAGRHEAVRAEDQLVHETGARYIDFVVPGLLGMNPVSYTHLDVYKRQSQARTHDASRIPSHSGGGVVQRFPRGSRTHRPAR